jgi:hypothetical protein
MREQAVVVELRFAGAAKKILLVEESAPLSGKVTDGWERFRLNGKLMSEWHVR